MIRTAPVVVLFLVLVAPAAVEPNGSVAEELSTPEQSIAIVDRPIPFDEERRQLTLSYLMAHHGGEFPDDLAAATTMTPRAIVLHWTGSGSLEGAWNTFAPVRLQGRADLVGAGAVNVSTHFLVDRDGTVYRLMPDEQIGRHVIGLNHLSIGVENIGDGGQFALTDAQVDANAELVRWLVARHPITHLLGHHEYRRMERHPYFQELDDGYRTNKADPGDEFMARVRGKVGDLHLESPPEQN